MPDQERPNLPRLDGFLASDGSNPYADDPTGPSSAQSDELPYRAPSYHEGLPYQPGDYVSRDVHHGPWILAAGIISVVLLSIACVVHFWPDVPIAIHLMVMVTCFTLGLLLGAAAWYRGRSDLKAIKRGVASADGRQAVRIGKWLGLIAMLICGGLVLDLLNRTIVEVLRNL